MQHHIHIYGFVKVKQAKSGIKDNSNNITSFADVVEQDLDNFTVKRLFAILDNNNSSTLFNRKAQRVKSAIKKAQHQQMKDNYKC